MGLDEFKKNVERAAELLAAQRDGEKSPPWLHERAIAGMAGAGFETLSADVGFRLGSAVARFRRIAKEVAEADGIAEPEQSQEAAAALRTIAEIMNSLPAT
jgi:hypothetical protein